MTKRLHKLGRTLVRIEKPPKQAAFDRMAGMQLFDERFYVAGAIPTASGPFLVVRSFARGKPAPIPAWKTGLCAF